MADKKMIYVVPVNGLRVPLPGTRECVPLTGMRVEQSSYITRRLREKSLQVVTGEADIKKLASEAQKAANAAGQAKAGAKTAKAPKTPTPKASEAENAGGNE